MPMKTFRMPAEWEPQAATWVSWPHNTETWPQNLAAAQTEFVAFVKAIADDQQANVMVPQKQMEIAQQQFLNLANVSLFPIETNDAWARDYAPTFVRDTQTNQLVSIDWYYNAWGGKYPPFDADQQVAAAVARRLSIRNVAGGLCFEGGAIEINSRGQLITTRSCALNPNRNAGKSLAEVEAILTERLGCDEVIWLPGEIDGCQWVRGDDTDGHVDQLVRFVDDENLVFASVDESDDRHSAMELNLAALKTALPRCRRHALPLPEPFEHCGRQIPASYCNFLITNRSVIVPQFDVTEDAAAVRSLTELFQNRKIVPLPSRNLSVGLGSFHCLSQNELALD